MITQLQFIIIIIIIIIYLFIYLFIYWELSFKVLYQVECEGKPLLQHIFPLNTCIFYLMMVEWMAETCSRMEQ